MHEKLAVAAKKVPVSACTDVADSPSEESKNTA